MTHDNSMSVYERMSVELMSAMSSIWANPRYRSEKKKLWRAVESWKEISSRYVLDAKDDYEKNVLLAFMNAVTYHIYEMPFERAVEFINNVIKTLKEV